MKAATWFVLAAWLTTSAFGQTADAGPRSACEKGYINHQGTCEDEHYDSAAQEVGTEEEGTTQAAPSSRFQSSACRLGYVQQGSRLCMTGARGPASFANAEVDCQDIFGRVAGYKDWRYRIFRGDGIAAPVGFWLGPITADNVALFVNLPNIGDFDGETSRFDSRFYVCAHDDDV